MKIGVDATVWQNKRGYGRHARALLSALLPLDAANQYVFFLDSNEDLDSIPSQAEIHLVPASAPTSEAASASGHRSLADMWRISRAMADASLDILWYPTIYSYVPVFSRARKIVMIHDIIAEKFPQFTLPSASARIFWRAKVAAGRFQAQAIATVSEFSRQQIVEYFKIPPGKVHVVGEASDPVFRRLDRAILTPTLQSLGLADDQREVVFVGGFGPHKNLEMLLRVFNRLVEENQYADLRLVMVGEYRKEVFFSAIGALQEQVQQAGMLDKVVFAGYLPDEELVMLLNRAAVLALPSFMEGFGLPAVEAAACGCPVVATTASPLPDLLGGGGLFCDPQDEAGFEKSLRQVLDSQELRQQMGQAGIKAAAALTWESAARQMQALLQKVVQA